jgi:hypothetical protein
MSQLQTSQLQAASKTKPALRSPRRITITMPYGAYQGLLDRSDREGRSLSNLAAFLLEKALTTQR